MEQVFWSRGTSRAHPSEGLLGANRDRNIGKDFLFKIFFKSSLILEMNTLIWWQQLRAPAVRPQAAFWMEGILLQEKMGWSERKPSLSWEKAACVDKNAKN